MPSSPEAAPSPLSSPPLPVRSPPPPSSIVATAPAVHPTKLALPLQRPSPSPFPPAVVPAAVPSPRTQLNQARLPAPPSPHPSSTRSLVARHTLKAPKINPELLLLVGMSTRTALSPAATSRPGPLSPTSRPPIHLRDLPVIPPTNVLLPSIRPLQIPIQRLLKILPSAEPSLLKGRV